MGIIILAQFPGTKWIAILLSGDGEPDPQPVLDAPRLTSPDKTPSI